MKLRINFALKSGMTGEIPVLAILSFGCKEYDPIKQKTVYKKLRYYTGVKVKTFEWNAMEKMPYNKVLQSELLLLEKTMHEVYNVQRSLNDVVTYQTLKDALDEKLRGKKRETVQRIRIVDFIETEVLNAPDIKKWTKEGYKTLRKYLEQFEGVYGRPVYNHEFNEKVYRLFMAEVWMRNNRYNSVTNVYKVLRATFNKIKRAYKVPVFNLTEELPKSEKQTNIKEPKVYLNFEQIQRVMHYIPKDEQQRNVKLILLTLIFSGCRYSDVFKIKPDHQYYKNGLKFHYARYITQKTNTPVIAPILKPLADAIEENDGKPAEKLDQSEFNKKVKVLLRDCGLRDRITLTYTDSYGNKQFEEKEFCDFVSSHIGRRSFVTNLMSHVPHTILSKITGHEISDGAGGISGDAIFGYNHINPEDSAVLFYRTLGRLQSSDMEHFIFPLV
jgi:integrase